jgi:hypothetical protein
MFSVCMVLGVVPVIPKRKEQPEIEIKMEETDEKEYMSSKSSKVKRD